MDNLLPSLIPDDPFIFKHVLYLLTWIAHVDVSEVGAIFFLDYIQMGSEVMALH